VAQVVDAQVLDPGDGQHPAEGLVWSVERLVAGAARQDPRRSAKAVSCALMA